MMRILFSIILIFSFLSDMNAQIEHVPVSHPVYKFLNHLESKGMMSHKSLARLPLQRKVIHNVLENAYENKSQLSASSQKVLRRFLKEFNFKIYQSAQIFPSKSDSTQFFSSEIIGSKEKLIYSYSDSLNAVSFAPLGSVEMIYKKNESGNRDVITGNLGFRLHGTIDNKLGYLLQVTNGMVVSGSRDLALTDPKLARNIKFATLNSDFDFTESHVRFDSDWFYAIIGRESRLIGAGLDQRLFTSTNSPPYDALSLGVRFESFDYRFTHASLIGFPESDASVGSSTMIPAKYLATHRFAVRPSWGEIAFWEGIIYSGRDIDLAYLNPLSFYKSLEHALRDRDNAIMGMDFTVRPIDNLQVKGTYLLDDIIFSKIGTGFWSNKSAWNIAIITSFLPSLDIGAEYSRVEPYTFTHYKIQNTYTNDSLLFGGYLLPNSDRISLKTVWWLTGIYPIEIDLFLLRHGDNIYDENGELVKNVGGDPFHIRRPGTDSDQVTFLDGDLKESLNLRISAGWEIFRGLHLHGTYRLEKLEDNLNNFISVGLFFGDF